MDLYTLTRRCMNAKNFYIWSEMQNIKVSIIVPVYNVADYLRRCLDSCVNQTLQEIEVVDLIKLLR